jgi:hypothetical protein
VLRYTPLPQNQANVTRLRRTAAQAFIYELYFRLFEVLCTYGVAGFSSLHLASEIAALCESDAELLEELISETRQDTIREIRDAWHRHAND